MAAQAVTMRTMYQAIGFSQTVATSFTDDEGLDSPEELAELDHIDEVRQLCNTTRKPGGGQDGNTVSNRAERRLTNTVFLCKMMVRVDRPLAPATIRPGVLLNTAQVQLEVEKKHRNDDAIFTPLDPRRTKDYLFSTIAEKFIERLGGRRNSQKIPINYVMRDDLAVPPAADDPPENYNTHDDEVKTRMRIIQIGREARPAAELEDNKSANWTAQANLDNKECYDMGEITFSSIPGFWVHVSKEIQRKRDGRAMLKAMTAGVLGPDARDARCRNNKRRYNALQYRGEKQHTGWREYVMKLLECQQVQDTLATEDKRRYTKWPEHENVQRMLGGISCEHLNATIEIIQADAIMKNSFSLSQQHILDAIGRHHEKNSRTGRGRNVSCADTKPTKTRKGRGGKNDPWVKNGKVDWPGINDGHYDDHLDKFKVISDGYPEKEWKNLHPMKKRKVYVQNHPNDKSVKNRSVSKVQIEDMELLKAARKHDQLRIASLKRKLGREAARKRIARGEDPDDSDFLASSYEDQSAITETTDKSKSNTSVKTGLKKRARRGLKKVAFEDPNDE
jgi:hypothetical protein